MMKLGDLRYYAHRIRAIFFKQLFDYFAATIYKTKQHIDFDENSNAVVLSLLQKKDMTMYLIAIKSFLHFVKVKKVIVVCDSDLTDLDRHILHNHIEKVEFYNIADFRHEKLPKGGCWERLTAISIFAKDYYVIQMDADTLTLHQPVEVTEAIVNNVPFILGTEEKYNKKFTLPEISVVAKELILSLKSSHIQLVCEHELINLSNRYNCYVRGCAGFAGFPKESISLCDLIDISNTFQEKFGSRWSEWGTEQFASNLLLSNLKGSFILPISQYTTPDNFDEKNTFLHFIGFLRYRNTLYQKLSLKIIRLLS